MEYSMPQLQQQTDFDDASKNSKTMSDIFIKKEPVDIDENFHLCGEIYMSSFHEFSFLCVACNTNFFHFTQFSEHAVEHETGNADRVMQQQSFGFSNNTLTMSTTDGQLILDHQQAQTEVADELPANSDDRKIENLNDLIQIVPQILLGGFQIKSSPNEIDISENEFENESENENKFNEIFSPKTSEELPRFQCSHCPKMFTRLFYLRNHENIHTGTSKYKCSRCSKAFTNNQNLQSHEVKCEYMTKSKVFPCSECPDLIFPSKEFLSVHNKKVHFEIIDGDEAPKFSNFVPQKLENSLGKDDIKKVLETSNKIVVSNTSSEIFEKSSTSIISKLYSVLNPSESTSSSTSSLLNNKEAPCFLVQPQTQLQKFSSSLAEILNDTNTKVQKTLSLKDVPAIRSFECSYCSKVFRRIDFYRKHVALHENKYVVQKFNCKYCSKVYTRLAFVRLHEFKCQFGRKIVHKKIKKCLVCEKRFYNIQKFKLHQCNSNLNVNKLQKEKDLDNKNVSTNPIKNRSPERKFSCHLCDKKFLISGYLNYHISKFHSGTDDSIQKDEGNISMENNKNIALYNVENFNQPQPMSEKLQKYVNDLNDICGPPYICRICKRDYSSKQTLKNHSRIHTGERPYKCKLCLKSFMWYYLYKNHLDNCKQRKEKLLECEICQSKFIDIKYLIIHNRKCHNYNVPVNPVMKTTESVNVTINQVDDDSTSSSSNLSMRLIKCKYCTKEFKSRKKLQKHLRIHLESTMKEINDLQLKCKKCGLNFEHKAALVIHEKTHESTQYSCEFCDKTFYTHIFLQQHKIEYHDYDELQTSSTLGTSIMNRNSNPDLYSNGYIPRPDGTYQCKLCKKSFQKSYFLMMHERRHQGIFPYKCRCGKTFATKGSMIVHFKLSHRRNAYVNPTGAQFKLKKPRKKFICPVCDRNFRSSANLHTHIDMEHKNSSLTDNKFNKEKKVEEIPPTDINIYNNNAHKLVDSNVENHQSPDLEEKLSNSFLPENFLSNQFLEVNKQKTKQFSCKSCRKVFKTRSEMASHIKRKICLEQGKQRERFARQAALLVMRKKKTMMQAAKLFGIPLCTVQRVLKAKRAKLAKQEGKNDATDSQMDNDGQEIQILVDESIFEQETSKLKNDGKLVEKSNLSEKDLNKKIFRALEVYKTGGFSVDTVCQKFDISPLAFKRFFKKYPKFSKHCEASSTTKTTTVELTSSSVSQAETPAITTTTIIPTSTVTTTASTISELAEKYSVNMIESQLDDEKQMLSSDSNVDELSNESKSNVNDLFQNNEFQQELCEKINMPESMLFSYFNKFHNNSQQILKMDIDARNEASCSSKAPTNQSNATSDCKLSISPSNRSDIVIGYNSRSKYTQRGTKQYANLQNAIEDLRKGGIKSKVCAKYQLPYQTLMRHLNKIDTENISFKIREDQEFPQDEIIEIKDDTSNILASKNQEHIEIESSDNESSDPESITKSRRRSLKSLRCEESAKKAIEEYTNCGGISQSQLCKKYNISTSTFQRYLRNVMKTQMDDGSV